MGLGITVDRATLQGQRGSSTFWITLLDCETGWSLEKPQTLEQSQLKSLYFNHAQKIDSNEGLAKRGEVNVALFQHNY